MLKIKIIILSKYCRILYARKMLLEHILDTNTSLWGTVYGMYTLYSEPFANISLFTFSLKIIDLYH